VPARLFLGEVSAQPDIREALTAAHLCHVLLEAVEGTGLFGRSRAGLPEDLTEVDEAGQAFTYPLWKRSLCVPGVPGMKHGCE
jgi:hypothetical protein